MTLLLPPIRAVSQLDDPVFLGVVLRSIAWAVLAFAAVAGLLAWAGHEAGQSWGPNWAGWLGYAAGPVGGGLLALFLFLPVATVIASLFVDRVADAVEHRYYPAIPPARPAALSVQIWDGIALGARVLALQVVALLLSLLLPGIGLVLGWLIAAWAIGRGLFVAVAMRRMDRDTATALYRRQRGAVIVQGGLMAAMGVIPLLNLLAPVLGTAAMVHVLHARD
ncbi:membrane protein of unknown function [Rhodovastum atsumiense]|nr:EI24 domain-containing protein [Rhodovastum atsumiense]CAH2600146.1 membrane protein of unknown function [Rhodovastum atsumiense]